MDPFDAYYQWLGIPPEEQPPHHYRLLGLRPFEDNPTVISHAADRQMSHLRTFQTGPHGAASQTLLNEIAAARVCLLHAEKKVAYDRWLQQAVAKTHSGDSPSWSSAAADPELAKLLDHVHTDQLMTRSRVASAKRTKQRRLATVLLLLVLLLGLALLSWGVMYSGHARPKQAGPFDPVQRPEPRPSSPGDTPAAAPDDDRATKAQVTRPEGLTPLEPDTNPPEPPPAPPPTAASPDETETVSPPKVADPPESKVETKLRAPAADVQRRILRRHNKTYEFSKNRTPLKAGALIQRLLKDGQSPAGTEEEQDERFVQLHTAMELACMIGEMDTMHETTDILGGRYDVDPWDLVREAFKQRAAKIKDPAAAHAFFLDLDTALQRALDAERFDVAEALARRGSRSSAHLRGSPLQRKWKESYQVTARLCKNAKKTESERKRLATAPDDPEANLVVGRWYCLDWGDWEKGLPHLAKGSDESLAKLATQELQRTPAAPDKQTELADDWAELAKSEKTTDRAAIRRHAADWYWRAWPALDDKAKAEVAGRLARLGQGQRCRVLVQCDNEFEMYVNGRFFMKGNQLHNVHVRDGVLAAGDIITVRVVDDGRGHRGFVCAILPEKGNSILTGRNWGVYKPNSLEPWYRWRQIGRVAFAADGSKEITDEFQKKTKWPAKSIWGKENTCYLLLEVR